MSREEKVRASQVPGITFGRDPDDPTWDVTRRIYIEWANVDGGAEGMLALLANHLHGCKWEDRLPGLKPADEKYIDRETFALKLLDALYP